MSLDTTKKIDTLRSVFYKECAKKFGCILCRKLKMKSHGIIDPHHVDGVGKADIGRDTRIVPVCRAKHHPQSPSAFKELCRSHRLDPEDLIQETQKQFLEEQGYEIPRDGSTIEEILEKAGLTEPNLGHRVSNGTAPSKGKKLPGARGSTKKCNQFVNGKFIEGK